MTDLEQARREAEAGMQAAIDHAQRAVPHWGADALSYIVSYGRNNQEFLAEDVRAYAVSKGLPDPSPRAWGNVFRVALQRGIIARIGYRPSPNRHGAPTTLWKSTSYWAAE